MILIFISWLIIMGINRFFESYNIFYKMIWEKYKQANNCFIKL